MFEFLNTDVSVDSNIAGDDGGGSCGGGCGGCGGCDG